MSRDAPADDAFWPANRMETYLAERVTGLDGKVETLSREFRIHRLTFHPDAEALCGRLDDVEREVRSLRRALYDVRAFEAHQRGRDVPPFWSVLCFVAAIAASFVAGVSVGSGPGANPFRSSADRGPSQYRTLTAPPEAVPLERSVPPAPPGGSPDVR